METPMRWRELFQEGRAPLTAGILLVEFLVAIESLVVTTIMPAIEHDLGGLAFYGLVFGGFSLAALVAAPIAGRGADRRGPAGPFALFLGLFAVGTVLAGLSTSMAMLALTRVLQGFGAGGAYTSALVAITRTYPESGRSRVLALLAGAWIVPGLLGPSFGALVALTAGWRWAFFSIVPLTLIAAILAVPALRSLAPVQAATAQLPLRWPILLGAGTGAIMIGISTIAWWTVPLLVGGGALAGPALVRILPAGAFRARPGMPVAVISIFLLILAFVGTTYFIPLLLTSLRHRSLAEAGLVITLGTVSWSLGSWWQSRAVVRTSGATLVILGAGMVALAMLSMFSTIAGSPLLIAYAGWFVAGVGMGIAYPTLYVVMMNAATQGAEGRAVAAAEVAERLGLALGGGIGGACITLAASAGATLSAGLAVTFGIALLCVLASIALAARLSPRTR